MNENQEQNIFDLRGQNVETQDSVILKKNNFDSMLRIVKQFITTVPLYTIKEQLIDIIRDECYTHDQLVLKMNNWVDDQQFLDWIVNVKPEELIPSSGTEIIDYPNEPVQPVNSFKSKIVDGGKIDHFE